MGLVEYAKSELDKIAKDDDGMQEMMNKDILEIVEIFSNQGHSGFSASYALSVLERLLRFKPLSPLTGNDDEWREPFDLKGTRQNKRCSSVFKRADGTCHDNNAIIVSDNGGITWFRSGRFRKQVSFPYTPPSKPEKVYIEYTEHVPAGFTGDKYDIITDDKDRIKRLYEKNKIEFDSIQEEPTNGKHDAE